MKKTKLIKNKKFAKGFTLIEVLIALTVLSISMLGVYSILNMSSRTLISAKERMFVIEKGYDRIARMINFPNKNFENVEDFNGKLITYTFKKESIGIPMVQQVTMTVSSDTATTKFIYYEKGIEDTGDSLGGF